MVTGRRGSKYQARMLREVRKQGTGEEQNRGSKEGSREVEMGREEAENKKAWKQRNRETNTKQESKDAEGSN